MAADPPTRPLTWFRCVRAWWWLLAALTIVCVSGVWDSALKTVPMQTFLPPDCDWVVAGQDFPRFWSATNSTVQAAAFRDAFAQRVHSLELAVRQLTGIRPTPGRWRAWLGPMFTAGIRGEQAGLCVRPGLLVRGADLLNRALHRPDSLTGLSRYGRLYYTWRDGWLICSFSEEFVKASSEAAPRAMNVGGVEELRVTWSGPQAGEVRIQPGAEWSCTGNVAGELTHRRAPLRLTAPWCAPPLASVTATKPSEVVAFVYQAWNILCAASGWGDSSLFQVGGRMAGHLLSAWGFDSLGAGWERPISECAFALAGLDGRNAVPVPVINAVFQPSGDAPGAHPLAGLLGRGTPAIHEWGQARGWVHPLLGEEWALCLATTPHEWLVSSREPEMRRLAGVEAETVPVNADLVARIDCARAAPDMMRLITRAAALELIPGMNERDVAAFLEPWARLIESLGEVRVEAWGRGGGRIDFQATLKKSGGAPS